MWGTIISFILGLAGKLFGIGQPADPEATAEATGETAGTAKTQAASDQKALQEVQTADDIREQVAASVKPGKMPADDGFERD